MFPRNASFREYYVLSPTQPPCPPCPPCPPPRHNFIVSAITFEGFKLRSSNTNISDEFNNLSYHKNGRRRPFCQKKKKKLHMKWPEMRSKVIFGHPKWPPAAFLSKKMKWPEIPSKKNFGHPKWLIDLK